MKRKGKRFLSLLLALVMIIGMMPGMSMTAYAASYEIVSIDASKVKNSANASGLLSEMEGFVSIPLNEAKGWSAPSGDGKYKRLIYACNGSSVSFAMFKPDGSYFNDSSGFSALISYGDEPVFYYPKQVIVAVTGVSLNKNFTTLTVGASETLTATVGPEDATDKTVKWSVGGTDAGAVKLYSDEACTTEVGTDATETLIVYAKGISAGSATVTATSNADSTKTASCDVTVNAAQTQTEELLTTITATDKEQASYNPENVATVSFSYTSQGYSFYSDSWGWWGYGWTATVTPADGYTITKCIFYDNTDHTATDSEAPFVVETTENDKMPKVNGSYIYQYSSSAGIKRIEVYGYAAPALDPVSYMAWNGTTLVEKTGDDACTDYTVVTADTTTFEDGKWYVVSNSVTVSSRITVTGTVNLILCDGATLTASKGITVNSGNTINIYAQSEGTGVLSAGNTSNAAGIGGGGRGSSSGTVNIHGGKITATGGFGASGIGGALEGGNGEVNIYSGEVTAQGQNFAAGIGGYSGKSGGTVNIYGGTVNASGKSYGTPGIGIGGTEPGSCVVHIYGGEVTATSEKAAAGIHGTVTIDGGTVTANGGVSDAIDNSEEENYSSNGINGTITINGGTVTATGGDVTVTDGYQSAIEGYSGTIYACNGIGGTVTISGGTVSAIGGNVTDTRSGPIACAIGGYYIETIYACSGIGGTVTISGGTVEATGGNVAGTIDSYAKTIYACNGVNGTVTISGGTVTATGGSHTGEFSSNGGTTVKEKGFGGSLTIGDSMKVFGGDSADPTTEIEKDNGDYARFKYMLVKHVHSFTYSASGATITAICSADGCMLPPSSQGGTDHVATLTIAAPTLETYGQTGDGISAEATLDNLEAFNKETGKTIATTDIKYVGRDGTTYQESATAPIDAGKYTAKITTKDENEDEITAKVDYEIAKAEPKAGDFTFTAPSGLTYDGNQKSAAVVPKDGITGMGDVTVKYYSDSEFKSAVSPTNAGTYYVGIEVAEGTNYKATSNDLHDEAWWFEIAKATPSKADFTFGAPSELTYDGKQKTATVVPNEGVTGMGNVAVKYYSDAARTEDVERPTNAGTYYVGITVAEGDNYTATTSVLHDSSWKFTIGKASATVTEIPTARTLTYSGSAQELVTAGTATGGTMQYAIGTATEATQPYTTSIPTATDAGTYHVWYRVEGNNNYNPIDPAYLSEIEIKKLEAEISWDGTTFEYNGKEQIPELIFKNKIEGDDVTIKVTGAGTDVGYYKAAFAGLEGEDADNYADPTKNLTKVFSIVKNKPAIEVSIDDWTYGEAAKEPVITGVPEGMATVTEYKALDENTYSPTVPSNAGKYTVRVTLKGDNNYESVSSEYNFTINQKTVNLVWGNTQFVYNGKDQIPTVTVTGLVGEDDITAEVIGAATAAGLHTATVVGLTGEGASNYKLPATVKKEFTILKADLPDDQGDNPAKVTMADWTYGEGAAEPVIENNISGGTVNYSYAKAVGGAALNFVNAKPSDAGSYIVRAQIGATESYNEAVLYDEFVISPRVAELNWGETSFVYDGQAHVPTCEVTNLTYGDKCDVLVSGATSTVGDHTATAAVLTNTNYALPGTATQTFNISRFKPSLTVSMTGWTYGDEPKSPAVDGNTGNADITYTYYKDEALSVKTGTTDGAGAEGGRPSFAGTYFVKATAAQTDGYETADAVAEFTIEKRILAVEWSGISFTYNGKEFSPVATATNIVKNDELILTVDGAKKDAGEYEAKALISGAAADNYELPAISTQRFKINKLMAELKWGEIQFVYNGSDQVPTVSVNNLIKGDEMTLTVVGAATAAGEHTATVTKLSNANYELPEEASQDFFIEKADVATEASQSENPAVLSMSSWTYGESAPEPVLENNIGGGTVTFSYALLPDGMQSGFFNELDYTTAKPMDAGVYIVKAEIGATENYNAAVIYSPFAIAPKTAQLFWSESSFVYDGVEHVPVCEVTNLEHGDECEVEVDGATSVVGNHTATATGLSNLNYVLPGTVSQNFTISKDIPALTVSIAGWTYGEEANDPAVEGNTGNADETILYYTDAELTTKTGEGDGAATEGGVPSYAGTYYVAATAAETDGYEAAAATAEFTIEQKLLAFDWSDLSFIYNGKEQVPSATPTNLVDGDEISLIISGAASAAGDYEATVDRIEGDRADCYALPAVLTQSFKIAKKVAELKWGDTEFIYNGNDQIPTVEVVNPEEGDVCELMVTGAATAVGTHKATVVKTLNDNYELPVETEKTFTIVKADLNEDAKVIISDWTYAENPSVPRVEGNTEGANVTYKYKEAGADDSTYTTTVPVNAGDYTVIAIIDTTAGYNEKPVTADFTIKKAESSVRTAPKAIPGLIYDSTAQELVTEGRGFGGTIKYAVQTQAGVEPTDEAYTESIVTGTLSGTYYVWYKVFGDANHNDTKAVMVEVNIIPVTREALIDYIGDVTAYYDEIKTVEDYAQIAEELKAAIDDAQAVADNDNVTEEQIGQALKALADAHNDAMEKVQDVIDTKAAKAVTDMIDALPAADKVTVYDERPIRDAVSAFEELTDPQVAKLDGATIDKLEDVVNALEKALEPFKKLEASNKKRDRLVEVINTQSFETINGIYQTPYDTVSMNYTVAKGKITGVSFDMKSLKAGDNFLTMNTGTRMILSDKFTVSNNFANASEYRKVAKSIKLKKYGYVMDIKKLRGRSTYELILVSPDGKKRLIIDVVDLSLNKKGLKSSVLTTAVKADQVGAKSISENKINEAGFIENGGVLTITSAPVLKSEINERKNRSARFISGVWMVGDTAIPYGKTLTVTKGKVTVNAKVNSDGTLSIAKAEGSGRGSMSISYILNGKVSVKKGKTTMKSKTYKAKVKIK